DDRCHFLSATLHDELGRYSARAEVAAAQQMSPAIASSAVAAGKAEGQGVPCTDATRGDVSDTLNAARQAVRRADAAGPAPAPQSDAPPPQPADAPAGEPPMGRGGSLSHYGAALGPYYLE